MADLTDQSTRRPGRAEPRTSGKVQAPALYVEAEKRTLVVPLSAQSQPDAEAVRCLRRGQRGGGAAPEGASAEGREQVDHAAVRILHLRVALTPERVPRLLVSGCASLSEFSVQTVDVFWRFTAERDRHPVSIRWWPSGRIERPNRFLGVEREAQSARERRLNMAVPHRQRALACGRTSASSRVRCSCRGARGWRWASQTHPDAGAADEDASGGVGTAGVWSASIGVVR
jgi:hypothetical protein